ncbi:hypothetical protein U27_02341 [Candidatus Vecturithrix granuli]|uniref:PD(D/E)XK endonuclease domain-containing protein n=1 Tax=Vecturithrix granuli TaxID=1499967 RepID=A0A0S6WBH0_VECG1|nr:hypothetical protein U27_02341 [Candidatus Vecturithrix granuli]
MGENSQNTNLASEYYVLSMLYRIGADAYLTLGNKKSVDIVVVKGGETLTIDVKGLKGTTNFPIDNVNKQDEKHYLIFVSFLNNIADPGCLPEVYIVPSQALALEHEEIGNQSLMYQNPKGNRRVVQLSRLRKTYKRYKDKWEYFVESPIVL